MMGEMKTKRSENDERKREVLIKRNEDGGKKMKRSENEAK